MITSLRLRRFKNFTDETLHLGPFTLIVGANASGKSNIRDALRFLHGIGRAYNLADIIGGRYGAGGQVEWERLRGAASEIVQFGCQSFALRASLSLRKPKRRVEYRILIRPDRERVGEFRVAAERLKLGTTIIYTSRPSAPDPVRAQDDDTHLLLRMAKSGEQKKYGHRVAVRPDQPALTQIREHPKILRGHKEVADQVTAVLASMRFLDLSPDRMRQPAFPGQDVLGDAGDNLPTVLKAICSDPAHRHALIDWTRELTPMDVKDVEFPVDPTTGQVQLAFRESDDRLVSAYAASDGTLRFLAMLAALLGTNPPSLYFFEEIDNGIHPSRLRLLLDLMETQTSRGRVQVVTTTHSPDLLSIIGDETFEHTSVVCRRPETDAAVIRPVAGLADAEELRRSQGLGRLHTSGWMEDSVFFEEGAAEDRDRSP